MRIFFGFFGIFFGGKGRIIGGKCIFLVVNWVFFGVFGGTLVVIGVFIGVTGKIFGVIGGKCIFLVISWVIIGVFGGILVVFGGSWGKIVDNLVKTRVFKSFW